MTETDFLICPICSLPLEKQGRSYLCTSTASKKHCFDIASSGYSDLSYRSGGSGDSKDAVNDRSLFLDSGYYLPLSNAINRICSQFANDDFFLIDAGCGEGYYSEHIAAEFGSAYVFGADLSKHAVHRASVRRNIRGGKNSFYAVSSVFSLPIRNESADFVLSMFAPVAENEVLRVLKNHGYLIIGAAGVRHLYDLKHAIYEEVRLNDERADLPKDMLFIEKTNVKYRITLDHPDDIMRLFGMTPYKFRTSEMSFELLKALKRLDVEIDVDFYIYKKENSLKG